MTMTTRRSEFGGPKCVGRMRVRTTPETAALGGVEVGMAEVFWDEARMGWWGKAAWPHGVWRFYPDELWEWEWVPNEPEAKPERTAVPRWVAFGAAAGMWSAATLVAYLLVWGVLR